jgi:hypothetical protein
MTVVEATRCRCGHEMTAHQHYRPGTDCALCDCSNWLMSLSAAASQ